MPKLEKAARRNHVAGFADLAWQVYNANPAVRHVVTVIALAATIFLVSTGGNSRMDQLQGWQQQTTGRLNSIGGCR